MTVHFTAEEFSYIGSAIEDTSCNDGWMQEAEELGLEYAPDWFMENVIRNDDGSVDVPDNVMPTLAEMLRDLHHEYAEGVLKVGWECEHKEILIEDLMQDFDCLCLATSVVMRNPDYIRLMKSYRRKAKRSRTKGGTTK